MSGPDLSFELRARAAGARCIIGVDEVGRGPIAGPVTAAAVCLDLDCIPEGLNDSKKLPQSRREALEVILTECAIVSVAHATVREIEEVNILRASHLAMMRAVAGLRFATGERPDHLLIDGRDLPRDCPCRAEAIIGGDGISLSIAAASIMAKVARDRLMVDLAQQHPGYGWETNAGYPTKSHISALNDLGVTPHHRRSFRPVHNILYQEENLSC
ncbi:ribonuclease HII [Brevirhabdus pacifica]|uniref:Ribonuclease HII n=1 Tax=Brevirhabdus pacifica TaxID=1267768 RepID=A0A1U7DIG9_9RHOB|nr:ribonuclease HII [Brevirhabdus pacifica]APX89761.1 ribonuclease HII [Brevirhabdus pacifica]OWU74596.1 ribonuclease HII [Loktanella sp. 22II-4b]PJJ85544.1 RNase HII [Brevirhabdus pacifica]